MELVAQLVTSLLVVGVGVALSYLMRDRFRQQDRLMDARLQGFRDLMDARFAAMEGRFDSVDAQFASIDRQFASLRSDLTQVALAVGVESRPQAG